MTAGVGPLPSPFGHVLIISLEAEVDPGSPQQACLLPAPVFRARARGEGGGAARVMWPGGSGVRHGRRDCGRSLHIFRKADVVDQVGVVLEEIDCGFD